jgi:hypothetical protein
MDGIDLAGIAVVSQKLLPARSNTWNGERESPTD